jgi:DNA-binding transcriptional regulator YdaS (Cro superfamily)
MRLKEWLFKKEMTTRRLARLLEVSEAHLYGIVNGKRWPHKRLSEKIEKATEGQVKATALRRKKRKITQQS